MGLGVPYVYADWFGDVNNLLPGSKTEIFIYVLNFWTVGLKNGTR